LSRFSQIAIAPAKAVAPIASFPQAASMCIDIDRRTKYRSLSRERGRDRVRLAIGFALLGIAVLGIGLQSTDARAQMASSPEEAACRPDVSRLCRGMSRDPMVILACLQSNRARLSRRCLAVLQSHGV
jgi:hypothetical protein